MIYFIQAGPSGPIKIGFSRDVHARLRGLQEGHYEELHIVATVEGGMGLERVLHRQLKGEECHRAGEWFDLTNADISDIIREILLGDIVGDEIADEATRQEETQLEFARRLIVEELEQASGDWVAATSLENIIVSAGVGRRNVKQARATLYREGMIEKRKIGSANSAEWQWRITQPNE